MNVLLVAVLCFAGLQDADARALLRLEDDWARALVKRDTVVFQRLLQSFLQFGAGGGVVALP